MKALITGSNGLLGSALRKELGENHIYHTRHDCDLRNYNDTNLYFHRTLISLPTLTEAYPNTLIHCAARVGGVQANMNDNKGFFNENNWINNNIVDNAIKYNFKNVINILSTCVFPDENIKYPLTADQIDIGKPHPSNHGYSYSKRLLYYNTKYAREVTGNNWISIIPNNIYGENDNFNLEGGHLVPALIRKGYEAHLTGGDFVVWGDGSALRQFIYSQDLAKIILWAIDNWKSDAPMMAVNEAEYSIKQIVNIIADRFKIPQEKIKFDTTKPKGQFRKPAASDVPIDFDFTKIEDGINKTIDWYISNQNNARKKL
jgi:GDP-L-fucose synthase